MYVLGTDGLVRGFGRMGNGIGEQMLQMSGIHAHAGLPTPHAWLTCLALRPRFKSTCPILVLISRGCQLANANATVSRLSLLS